MSSSILVKNGFVITMDARRKVFRGDIYVAGDTIKELGSSRDRADLVIDAAGKWVIPGLIQTHIHLAQTLFRNQADDLELLDWLKKRILPFEAAHNEETLKVSALLGVAELIKGGTTCILDMATVNHSEVVFGVLLETGIRAASGKAMMDHGSELPSPLKEKTSDSLKETEELIKAFHLKDRGRVRYAVTPRFVLSSTRDLLLGARELALKYGLLLHTHASENREEIRLVRESFGQDNIEYLHSLGFTGERLLLAHCVHVTEKELEILKDTGTKVLHCPSSNLKLASGIAPIPKMLEMGIEVSLGADGAPCNNNLDAFLEMRLASLIQKPIHGPKAMPAETTFALATLGGAKALGLEKEIGSLEVGKKADLVILNPEKVYAWPVGVAKTYSLLVYALRPCSVETTIVDGKPLYLNGKLLFLDEEELMDRSSEALTKIMRMVS